MTAFGISMSSIVCNEKTPKINEPRINDAPKLNFFLIKKMITRNAIITPRTFNMTVSETDVLFN
jgi:hypothetical protein